MYSSKRCRIYVSSSGISVHKISANLGPKNFTGPENSGNIGQKKRPRFSLTFTPLGFPCSGPLRATFWTGAWLVLVFAPNFPKFWTKRLVSGSTPASSAPCPLAHLFFRVESATPAYLLPTTFSILLIEKSAVYFLQLWMSLTGCLAETRNFHLDTLTRSSLGPLPRFVAPSAGAQT